MRQETPRLSVAHLTDVIDGRLNSGTARAARELIIGLSKYTGIHQTFIHFDSSSDEIYNLENTTEIVIPLVRFPFAKHFISFIFFWIKQRLIHKSYFFDVVHWHSSRVYPFFFLIPSARIVITLHDATIRLMREVNTFWTRVFYWSLRLSVKRVHAIIGDSADACKKLVLFGKFPSDKVACLYLGSDFDQILSEKPLRFNPAEKYFLCISRWQPHKNVERLVEGYANAIEQNPELPNLVLVGKPVSGHNFPLLKVIEYNLTSRVEIFQDLSDSELAFMYDNAFLNIAPSLHEGFGFTVLEGLKRNCPSLDHAFTSTAEISQSAGFHINMASSEEISKALLSWTENLELQLQLASNVKKRASLFTWENTTSTLIEIYMGREPLYSP